MVASNGVFNYLYYIASCILECQEKFCKEFQLLLNLLDKAEKFVLGFVIYNCQ